MRIFKLLTHTVGLIRLIPLFTHLIIQRLIIQVTASAHLLSLAT